MRHSHPDPISCAGGAGAGNWGRVGEEYDAEDYLDYNDPNYDPEEQVGAVMEASSWSEC